MSSKRDRLKEMRNARKTSMSDDTPAEDYSKEAAKALSAEEQPDPETPPVKAEPVQTVPEMPKTTPELPAEPKIEKQTPEMPAKEDAPENASEGEKKAQMVTPPRNIYSVANEPGKRISVSLRTENKNWMHRTAIRCGLSIQDYINVLIAEAWEREKEHPYVWSDTDPLPERIPSSKTVLVAIKLTDDNIERSKRMRAAHSMTMTYYMNYLIEEEMKREQAEGMRPPVFGEL